MIKSDILECVCQVDNLRHGETYSFRVASVARDPSSGTEGATLVTSEPSKPSSPLVIPDSSVPIADISISDPVSRSNNSNSVSKIHSFPSLQDPSLKSNQHSKCFLFDLFVVKCVAT